MEDFDPIMQMVIDKADIYDLHHFVKIHDFESAMEILEKYVKWGELEDAFHYPTIKAEVDAIMQDIDAINAENGT